MTATPSIDLPAWMVEQLSQASLLRQMVQTFAEALMSADADAVCSADQASPLPPVQSAGGSAAGKSSRRTPAESARPPYPASERRSWRAPQLP